MSVPNEETSVAVATETAEKFVDSYYHALQSQRSTIASFYQKPKTLPDGKKTPSITYNGEAKTDGAAMQKLFQDGMASAHFDVQGLDAQCLNPNYIPDGTAGGHAMSGKNLTVLVTVNGYVKFGDAKTASTRGFIESFVLIPNQDNMGPRTRAKQIKDYIIQSQTFRVVV